MDIFDRHKKRLFYLISDSVTKWPSKSKKCRQPYSRVERRVSKSSVKLLQFNVRLFRFLILEDVHAYTSKQSFGF
jgi:hypothetical protein